MAVAKAKNQSAAMILLARRSPDMVYEYSGWQIARYLSATGDKEIQYRAGRSICRKVLKIWEFPPADWLIL